MPANAAVYIQTDEKINLNQVFDNIKSDKGLLRKPSYYDVELNGHTVRYNVMDKAKVPDHIQGLLGYIAYQDHEQDRKEAASALVKHTHTVLGLVSDKDFNDDPAIWESLFTIAKKYNGFVFAFDSAFNSDGSVFFGPMFEQQQRLQQQENNAQPDQVNRKEKSKAILESQNIPYIESLPVVVSESDAQFRTQDEISHRVLCLIVIAAKADGAESHKVDELITNYSLSEHFTPKEHAFLANTTPSDQEKNTFIWRYESAWVMLWTLGFVENMEQPEQISDIKKTVDIFHSHSTTTFKQQATLRPKPDVLDLLDLTYRYHWAATDARIKKQDTPAGVNPSVVYERHYALNWITGYMEQEWDEVSTNT